MKSLRAVILCCMMLGIGTCSSRRAVEPSAGAPITIHYLSPEVATYLPVTPDDIIEKSTDVLYLDSDVVRARDLVTILNEAPSGKFDRELVRIRIALTNGKVIFVDKLGGVMHEGGERHLTPGQFSKLLEAIKGVSRSR